MDSGDKGVSPTVSTKVKGTQTVYKNPSDTEEKRGEHTNGVLWHSEINL